LNVEILNAPLLKALLDGTIPFHEVMNAFDIRTSIAFNLPSSIYGFTYVSRKGNYHLILNGNVNFKTQCEVFLHEIKHILNDIPERSYFIGLDMQHTQIENEADKTAEEIIEYRTINLSKK